MGYVSASISGVWWWSWLVLVWLPGPAGAQPAEAVPARLGDDGVQRLEVTLESYAYTPRHIIVQAGLPVELTLYNDSFLTPHNFILLAPEAGFDIDQNVRAGQRLTVRFTPTTPGTYTFYCDKKLLFFPSHREEGMEGTLDVRAQSP
ncbi:MAG: cupredoxin domain-containing protein [Nitrospirales bacterium]